MQNLHKTFLRTVPPYSHQADVWIKLLRHLGYSSIVFIHSSDNDGRATLGRFHNVAAREKNVVHVREISEILRYVDAQNIQETVETWLPSIPEWKSFVKSGRV